MSSSAFQVTVANTALAWINFNGTGTPAIRSSFNVSSLTDHGTGNYTANFTNALPNANYAVLGTSQITSGVLGLVLEDGITPVRTTTAFRFFVVNTVGGAALDSTNVNLAFFGG